MSKYIKLDDAIDAYNQAVTNLVESEMEEFDLGDFTECSFNTTQIKLIERMIASLPTIEVSEEELKGFDKVDKRFSEDAISRASLIKRWNEMSVRGRTEFDQEIMVAPSVVPKPKEGEWIKDGSHCRCSNCGYLRFAPSIANPRKHYCENCGAKMKGEAE